MTTPKEEKRERQVVELMTTAKAIADDVFGAHEDCEAVFDVYDWLEKAPNAEELVADLKRVYAHAGRIFKTSAPTAEQVFGLFEYIYPEE